MKKAVAEIRRLTNIDAQHIKKGFRMSEATPQMAIDHARDELNELERSPNDIFELADILGCLLHYAEMKEWSLDKVEAALLTKLQLRFEGSKRKPKARKR